VAERNHNGNERHRPSKLRDGHAEQGLRHPRAPPSAMASDRASAGGAGHFITDKRTEGRPGMKPSELRVRTCKAFRSRHWPQRSISAGCAIKVVQEVVRSRQGPKIWSGCFTLR